MHRRTFLSWLALAPPALLSSAVDPAGSGRTAPDRLFFASGGKTCLIAADGSGLEVLTFDAPDQATWQPCGFFPDGRVLLLSMEPRRDGPGRPFDQYYHQTPTHLWTYDLKRKALIEIATRDRLAPFTTPALLLGDDRLLVQVVRRGDGQIYSIRLDGSDARAFTQPGEGMPYGLSASPDGKRVAFHMATPQGYQVFTADASGTNRKRVAGAPAVPKEE